MGIRHLFFDQVEDFGTVRRIYFHLQFEQGRDWHYFGSDPVAIPPNEAGTISEYPSVDLPQDMDDLPSEYDYLLQQLALQIGLVKEGLE